ncbi:MAG: hypothetical protein HQK84_02245 [Nitrospinae bacterium]|nr:hypothetical protein [Nitrospinota bacterium]
MMKTALSDGGESATSFIKEWDENIMDFKNLDTAFQENFIENEITAASPFEVTLPQQTIEKIYQFIRIYFAICHRNSYQMERGKTFFHQQLNYSVLMGYDFHITENKIKLIEVNTNAGGALFSLLDEYRRYPEKKREYEKKINVLFESFCEDFTLWNKGNSSQRTLKTVAIIDEDIEKVYWLPEFKLFQSLFEERGIKTIIADVKDVQIDGNELKVKGIVIDMVYNRYCDFYLKDTPSSTLREAYEENLACFSPNPFEYHLTASKDILMFLSDETFDEQFEITSEERTLLDEIIPKTYHLSSLEEHEIIDKRKQFFFKPISHYGGKGVYRGDKISLRKIHEIEKENYLMQELVHPSTVTVNSSIADIPLKNNIFKVDYRFFVYKNEAFHFSSRLYQGQVTNFKTIGGGYAPVIVSEE